MKYKIHNRRYIGNKHKLLSFIDNVLNYNKVEFNSFADLFAGTGVVSEYFLSKNKSVIINDNLYSNYVFYVAWLSNLEYDKDKINNFINYYNNSMEYIKDNYFSDIFSGTYFNYNNAKQIGSIRVDIEKNREKLNLREYCILLSSLLYTTDKIANTCGHFEAFLAKKPQEEIFKLQDLDIKKYKYKPKIFQENANVLIKKIKADLVYIDPPYNSRQYINFYHLLENLAEWKQPKVFGKTLKMERNAKKSEYSKANALNNFKDLILNCNSQYVLVSYNNTYKANSNASINKILEKDIYDILSSVGKTEKFDIDYKYFNTGKTNFSDHKEMLFLCKI